MEKKTVKNFCNRCKFETNHTILHTETIFGSDEYRYQNDYMIVECNGCETKSFREEFIDYESAYPDEYGDWNPEITISNFPVTLRNHKKLENSYGLPPKIRTVYNEAIKAFTSECYLLTGVAFRAIIEAICIDKEIPGKDLGKKIDGLVRNKLITEKEAQRLHSIRFIGNDSVHEMSVPKENVLYIVLDIIEHLLKNLYLIDEHMRDHLETIINIFSEFEEFLSLKVAGFNKGEELPMAKIFGKSMRRLNGKTSEFETELIRQIQSGNYSKLILGKVGTYGNASQELQHFIIA